MNSKPIRSGSLFDENSSDTIRPWDETNPKNWIVDPLEIRIRQIESRLERMEAILRDRFGVDVRPEEVRNPHSAPKKKRGPSKAIAQQHLLIRRDALIGFLEFYWPTLGRLFSQPHNGTAILLALQRCAKPPNSSLIPYAETLLKHSTKLLSFLRSGEYHGDPRQVANAMAGVPEYAWSTSLKKCANVPSERAIGEPALRDYIRRNCPSAFSKLLNAESPEEAARIMKSVRTADRELLWLISRPNYLLKVLERGRPRKSL